ncbi:hypothetical protein [uncultured Selenomonas sp.]|uniref:hypothetical protein n=1 Tax=uncultured Selenomonas sp. TaxID=159275 RepID=UPI0025D7D939|nr:hypothetical protein [uncultured Selenomonas sp.]
MKRLLLFFLTLVCLAACAPSASAAPRTVTATGEYTMGEAETLSVARERALEDAKRNAAEQVGVYVTSATTVENLTLTQDTVTTMTAAFLRLVGAPRYTTIAHEDTLAITVRATITAQADDGDVEKIRGLAADPARVATFDQLASSYQRLQREAALLQKRMTVAHTPEEKKEIQQAIHKNEAAWQSYLLLQQAYAQPDADTKLLDQAIALYPANVPAYVARAGKRLGADDLAASLQDADAGLAALQTNTSDYTDEQQHVLAFILQTIRGSVHFLTEDYDAALADFQTAEKETSTLRLERVSPGMYAHFLFDYGGVEMLKGDDAAAETHFTRLITHIEAEEAAAAQKPAPPTPPDKTRSLADERNLMCANAHIYRAVVRWNQKKDAKSDLAKAREIAKRLPDNDRKAIESAIASLPSLEQGTSIENEASGAEPNADIPANTKADSPAPANAAAPAPVTAVAPTPQPPAEDFASPELFG